MFTNRARDSTVNLSMLKKKLSIGKSNADSSDKGDDGKDRVVISVSAPITPRDRSASGGYMKALNQVNQKLRESQKRLLEFKIKELESDDSSNEDYSAYYTGNDDTSRDDSELGTLTTPRRANTDYVTDDRLKEPKQFKKLPQTLPLAKTNITNDEISSSSTDPSLPPIPDQMVVPPIVKQLKPSNIHATLSRKLELKHPCSPRLSESRDQLFEAKKVLELQTMLFELRMQFWKIENSREQAIENYHNLAGEAGYMICNNCKRLLRDLKLVDKLGNYHMKKHRNKHSRKPRYKCTQKTYDEHFISTPIGKFFPLSLER